MTPYHGYSREAWTRFHRELGKVNLHMIHEGQVDGTWSAPLYTLIRSGDGYYQQRVGGTTGRTMADALARGLATLSSPLYFGQPGIGVRLALLTLLMEDATCARS